MHNNEELSGGTASADTGRAELFSGDVMARYWDWKGGVLEAAAKKKSSRKSTKKKSARKTVKRPKPKPKPTKKGPGCDSDPINTCR